MFGKIRIGKANKDCNNQRRGHWWNFSHQFGRSGGRYAARYVSVILRGKGAVSALRNSKLLLKELSLRSEEDNLSVEMTEGFYQSSGPKKVSSPFRSASSLFRSLFRSASYSFSVFFQFFFSFFLAS